MRHCWLNGYSLRCQGKPSCQHRLLKLKLLCVSCVTVCPVSHGTYEPYYSSLSLDVDTSLSASALRQVRLAHAFYIIKLIEFMDTFIFVLRKRQRQISFLHVFHHFAVPLSLWFGIKVVPGDSFCSPCSGVNALSLVTLLQDFSKVAFTVYFTVQ